ncbi:hypothetical protein D9M68_978190 [compost metagenome]
MRVAHRYAQRRVPQDVPSPHDEMGGEGIAQDVARLALGRVDRGREQDLVKDTDAVAEWAVLTPVLVHRLHQGRSNRNRPHSLRLGIGEGYDP